MIDFPINPTSGQTYSYNNTNYTFNGIGWVYTLYVIGQTGSRGVTGSVGATGNGISSITQPSGPSNAQINYTDGTTSSITLPRGATGGFTNFGAPLINLTLPVVASSASTTFSQLFPQTINGIWYNQTNNQYYISTAANPGYIERRSSTYSLVSRHISNFGTGTLPGQIVGSTASDIVIANFTGTTYYEIFNASTMIRRANFVPTSGSFSAIFDVDFTNKLLYTSVQANGLTYVWNLGATFSGPFTLQTTISVASAGVYVKVDEARNRLIIVPNASQIVSLYLNAVGTFSQYSQELAIPTVNLTGNTVAGAGINFDNDYYYFSVPNYGIYVLDRTTFRVRSFIVNTSAGNLSNGVNFMGVDNVNKRLLLRWQQLSRMIEIKSIDTTNGFNQY